jgi:hypothetical protein
MRENWNSLSRLMEEEMISLSKWVWIQRNLKFI